MESDDAQQSDAEAEGTEDPQVPEDGPSLPEVPIETSEREPEQLEGVPAGERRESQQREESQTAE